VGLFAQDMLRPGVRKREVLGWALYDFANSGYTTVVITAVFATYFVGVVAEQAPWATLAWTAALAVSHALVMLIMPGVGAWADRKAAKKRVLVWTTLGCVLSTAALAWVGPGQLALGIVLIILSNLFYAMGESMAGAFLPEIATPESMGKISGWGWALGYVGGMLCLGLCLAYVLASQAKGMSAAQFVPVTMLITAAMYGAAATFTFVLLRERAAPNSGARPPTRWAMIQALQQLRQSWRQLAGMPDLRQLLCCIVAYQAGVSVAIAVAAIYAEQVVGFKTQETMTLIFALNVAAMVGAFVWGYVQDAVGHRKALALTLVGWIITCLLAAVSTDKTMFWCAAAVAGFCMGSSQSAGRAMAGVMVPQAQLAEFFGLWSFAVRLSSILGPLIYGLITWISGGNQRTAILVTALMFVLGLILLRRVDVARGQALVQRGPDRF
jgi:MFS transporter, UMF1 family